MAQAVSSQFRVRVLASGQQSALAQFVASMAPNTWAGPINYPSRPAPFPMNGLNINLTTSKFRNDGASVISYQSVGCWDPIHKKIVSCSAAHGNLSTRAVIEYDDATNTWSSTFCPGSAESKGLYPPWPSCPVEFIGAHTYHHNVIDPATGTMYYHRYASKRNWKRPPGSSGPATPWVQIADNSLHAEYSNGMQWNPHLFGGEGGVHGANIWGIEAYRPSTNTWHWIHNDGRGPNGVDSLILGQGGSCAFYDPANGSTYFCGGDDLVRRGAAGKALVEANPFTGVCTQKASIPIHKDVKSPADADSYVPVSGWNALPTNYGAKKPVVIGPGSGNCKEYDSATDIWTSVATRSWPLNGYGGGLFMVPISTYGCILVIISDNGAMPQVHIWKR